MEIISYPKMLADAKMRNSIFFQKLGITNVDPSTLHKEDDDTAINDVLDSPPIEAELVPAK